MLRRTRTTKKLARRIDLQYFARPHPLRRWRFWLSLAVPVLALCWILTQRVEGGQKAYSSGLLAPAHAVLTQQCGLCHVTRTGTFFKEVSDDSCLTCHDGPIHHANQRFTPHCSSCHVEHKGARLSAASDSNCVQCHANLQSTNGQPPYAASVSGFQRGHPPFSALAKGKVDQGTIRLNHYLHLQPNLIGPDNKRVQMTCDDCHRADAGDGWPFASAVRTASVVVTEDTKPIKAGTRMTPIRFTSHCAGCHTLQFDKRLGNEQVPHDRPEVVHAFLTKRFEEYIVTHPAAVHEVEPPNRQRPEGARIPRVARNAGEWVQFRVDDAEWLLWTKTCRQCHVLNSAGGGLPEVAKSNITLRWLPHGEFDHHAHRMMSCIACHTHTPQSHDTSDILLPSIEICRQCHRESGSSKEAAEGRCFECHQYHDWGQARRTKGLFTIPELRGTARLSLPQE